MEIPSYSRRTFLASLLGTGVAWGMPSPPDEDCESKLLQQFLHSQERDLEEKVHLFRALIQRFGKGVLETVHESIVASTREKLRKADLKERNLDGVMEYLWKHTTRTHCYQIQERSTERLQLKITRCFYAEQMRRLQAPELGLALFCSYDVGFCQGLQPKMLFQRRHTLMEGDVCCDHCYILKLQGKNG